jgi:hypothetical protein
LVATKFIDENLSVDWASPPVYDIYLDEGRLLEEVNLVLDTINIVEGNDVHLVFEESSKSEISQWGLEKINYVDFLGIETFLSTFPKQNLDVGVGMVEEIGANNFKYNTRSMLMMKIVAFIGVCCFVLVLRIGEWNELTGHLKDRGKNWPNSKTNSLQQGENDADCIAVNLFYFLNRLYVVILVVLGFWESLFHYFIRFRDMEVFM